MNREQKKLATRQRILECAAALFAEQDYASVSTRQIAQAAGIANGTLFSHFADKYELTKALFLQEIEQQLSESQKNLASNCGGLEFFAHHSLQLYRFYARDFSLAKALLQNNLFEQAYFSQQLEGFIADIARHLLQEKPDLTSKQRKLIANSWMGFYFFQLFVGLSAHEQSPDAAENWHATLMGQCKSLLKLTKD